MKKYFITLNLQARNYNLINQLNNSEPVWITDVNFARFRFERNGIRFLSYVLESDLESICIYQHEAVLF